MKNIPNILSVLRLLMAFVFAVLFISDRYIVALCVFVLAGITDVADGILARKNNWITDAGKILDPVADKLMQFTALVCLSIREYIPAWLLVMIFVKEAIMGVGSLVFYRKFRQIGVSKYYGKAYTVLFYIAVAMLIVFRGWFNANVWAEDILCICLAAVGFIAVLLYYISYLKGKLRKVTE